MSKPKKMTISSLKREDSRKYTKKLIRVGDYEVTVDEQLRPTKIQTMIAELIEKDEYASENGYLFNPSEYALILFVKYFSDISVPSEYEKQIAMLSLLVDLEYLEPIINSFDKEEMDKLNKMIKQYHSNLNLLMNELVKMAEEDKSEVETVENIEVAEVDGEDNGN